VNVEYFADDIVSLVLYELVLLSIGLSSFPFLVIKLESVHVNDPVNRQKVFFTRFDLGSARR
jgi:hypothetical protein